MSVTRQAGINPYDNVFKSFGLTGDGSCVKAFTAPLSREKHTFLYPEQMWKGVVSTDSILAWFDVDVQPNAVVAFTE